MPKIGRNDPCYCGSGKKYKQCHLPIEQAAEAEQRRLRQAHDTLLPKLIDAARNIPEELSGGLEQFWNGKYTIEQLSELDDLEQRGAERFLTWFAFDYRLKEGRTLVEQLAIGEQALELNDHETQLLRDWVPVRLRPYIVQTVLKGQTVQVRDLLDETLYEIEDHAASRRVAPDEVLIVHLTPAGQRHYIGGAAAHLTADTREKLREYLALHLEAFTRDHPDATWADLIRDRSEILNHFVMALPVEEPDPSLLDNIIVQTRVSLRLAGESLGIGRRTEETANTEETEGTEETEEP